MKKSILSKKVTYDFARLMDGATQVSCSGFGKVMIDNMWFERQPYKSDRQALQRALAVFFNADAWIWLTRLQLPHVMQ